MLNRPTDRVRPGPGIQRPLPPVDHHFDVHQVVRALDGALLADETVRHRFTIADEFIREMDVELPPTLVKQAVG